MHPRYLKVPEVPKMSVQGAQGADNATLFDHALLPAPAPHKYAIHEALILDFPPHHMREASFRCLEIAECFGSLRKHHQRNSHASCTVSGLTLDR